MSLINFHGPSGTSSNEDEVIAMLVACGELSRLIASEMLLFREQSSEFRFGPCFGRPPK